MVNLFKTNGLATYLRQLYKQLSKKVTIHFLWINSEGSGSKFTQKLLNGEVHYFIPSHIGAKDIQYEKAVVAYLSSEIQTKENIVFHFNWINHCSFAYLLKQGLKCKTVLTQHCTPWRELITKDYPTFVKLNKLFSNKSYVSYFLAPALKKELWSYQAMDHIICVSESGKKSLTNLVGYSKENATVIYNGIDIKHKKFSAESRTVLRKKYRVEVGERLIFFAGAVTEKKGVFDIIKAFDKVVTQRPSEKIRLIIAGQGDISKLIKTTNKNWLNITFTGHLSKERLFDFYQMSDIGVVPSYVEPFGYVALEMMYFGLPIIVSDVDGLKEIVPDDCGLKVRLVLGKNKAYIDQKQLAEKIQYYLDNPSIAKQYAANAQRHAKKNFTAKRMAWETIAVYEKLATEKNEQTTVLINDSSPLISVLLSVHNGEKYLGGCMDSVFSQTYSKFELIIVDDGSIDKTAAIVRQYEDERIVYVKNEKNEGFVNSLNKGIAIAKGKYIARIDVDDSMHPERLQKQVAFLEHEKNKEVAVVGCHHYVIDSTGKMISLKQYPVSDAEIRKHVFSKSLFTSFSHVSY